MTDKVSGPGELQALIQLLRRARQSQTKAELAFAMVNETRQLVTYRQAVVWQKESGVIAVSGRPDFDKNSPYVQWMNRLAKKLTKSSDTRITTRDQIGKETVGNGHGTDQLANQWADQWDDWLPPYCLSLAIKKDASDKDAMLWLILACDSPPEKRELLEEMAQAYGHAWDALSRPFFPFSGLAKFTGRKAARIALILAAALVLALPVRLSVLVPAEVAAKDPYPVCAPLNGVIDQFHIKPNESVTKGQPLFDLEKTLLKNRLNLARTTLKVARAELQRASQLALFADKNKLDLKILQGRLTQKKAEVAYVESLLKRIRVKAQKDGVALFQDVFFWQGRAVDIGEKVLTLADPGQVELVLFLPVADAIPLEPGARVTLFLNTSPDRPLTGTLNSISYRAQLHKDNQISYRLKSSLDTGNYPRIGLTGTAKIYGEKVTVFYYLFRRPISAMRCRLGI